MSLRINKKHILQYFLIYWMLLDAGSAAVSVIGINAYYLSLFILGLVGCILYRNTNQFKEVFRYRIQLFCIVLIFLYFITFLITSGGLYYTIILQNVGRILIVLYAVMIDRKNFVTRFVNVVTFLASISLIIFWGYFIAGTGFWSFITSHLPIVRAATPSLGAQYGAFILCFNYFDPTRNTYIFGEPGEYQLVISTALFLMLFLKPKFSDIRKKINLIILLVTLVTIQSTTGYFNLIVLVACVLIAPNRSNESDKRIIKRFITGLVIIAIIGIIFFDGWDYFVNKVLVEKTLDESGNIDFTQGTAAGRWNGFVRLWDYMSLHPFNCIFGIGFGNRIATGVTSCNGFTNSILDFGILTMLWLVYSFTRALYTKLNLSTTFTGLFVIMNTWFGQPVPLYTLMIVIAFVPLLTSNVEPSKEIKQEEYNNELQRISI